MSQVGRRLILALLPPLLVIAAGEGYSQGDGQGTNKLKQNVTAAGTDYACPMHPEDRLDKPGKCSQYGMQLTPTKARPSSARSLSAFKATFTTEPRMVTAGEPVTLTISLTDKTTGQKVTDFEVAHERLMHLIVVNRDLSFFDPLHPEYSADGTFRVQTIFTQGGEYKLYADVTLNGHGQQILREMLKVNGPSATAVPLVPDRAFSKTVDDLVVRLTANPSTLRTGAAKLTFSLKDAYTGRPVTDLSSYLGALGHCVIISQDTSEFLQSHPLEPGQKIKEATNGHPYDHGAHEAERRGGPEVAFHTSFPKPGLYKVWGQFNHRGQIVTADFVILVNQ